MARVIRRMPHHDPKALVGEERVTLMNQEQRDVLVLRRYTGGGPYPDVTNLEFWRLPLVIACLKRAISDARPEPRRRS